MSGERLHPALVIGVMVICLILPACTTTGGPKKGPSVEPEDYKAALAILSDDDSGEVINVTTMAIESGQLSGDSLAQAYFRRAGAWYSQNDLDQAIADFEQALQHDPSLTIAYANLGDCFARKGEHNQAIDQFSQFLAANPDHSKVLFKRGTSYFHLKNFDQAIADFTRVIELDPSNDAAYLNRGIAFTNQGHYKNAMKDIDHFLQTNPGDPRATKVKAYLENKLETLKGQKT